MGPNDVSGSLTEEQIAKIRRNRQLALQRRLTRSSVAPNSLPTWWRDVPCDRDPAEVAVCDYEARPVMAARSPEDRDGKQKLVATLLCRWWYVLPDWPPRDVAYYDKRLETRNLRRVVIEVFDREPEMDSLG